MKRFKVGDTCYVSDFGRKEVQIDCPVCFRTGKVTLILGNGNQVEMPCDFCTSGLGTNPKGYVNEWRMDAGVKLEVITAVNVNTTTDGDQVEYQCDYRNYQPKFIFETKEDALAFSDIKAKAYNHQQDTKAEFLKNKPHKSYGWNAGYHMMAVKEAEKKIEYHSKKAKICKAKAKGEPE